MEFMKRIFFSLIFLFSISTSAQINLFPSELNVHPFSGNLLEPRMGALFGIGMNDLRLDIGNSRDLIHYSVDSTTKYSIGADFFTYTRLRGESDFHFPVDAVDYLFGINFSVKKQLQNYNYGARIRVSHISAHMVDGHFDNSKGIWRDNRNPIVYSREFIELTPFFSSNDYRFYFSAQYLFHVVPDKVGKSLFQLGGEYFYNVGAIFPFIAYDFKLMKINEWKGTNSLTTGIKMGKVFGNGLTFFYQYHSGFNVHGEYYDIVEKKSFFGINIEF